MKTTALLLCLLLSAPAWALPHSAKVRAEFQREHPCPINGKKRGACPNFVADHRIALCVGGADSVENLRWMHVLMARQKDLWECRPGWEAKLRYCEAHECFVGD